MMPAATEKLIRVLLIGAADREDVTAIETLRAAGWAVKWWATTDGREVDRLLRAPLDVVLLWIAPEAPDPRNVFELLRRSGRSLPVVLVDSPEAGQEAVELVALGVRAVVSIDRPAQLVAAVGRAFSEARREELIDQARAISHDLNNLLAVIPLATESLRGRLGEASDRRLLDSIERVAAQATAAVDSLYRTALWSQEEDTAFNGGVSLRHLIEALARRLRSSSPAAVETDYPADLGSVRGSPRALRQLLLCLALDAAQVCGGETTLRVTARRHPDGRRVSVAMSATGTVGPATEPSVVTTLSSLVEGVGAELGCSRSASGVSYLLTLPLDASTPRAPV